MGTSCPSTVASDLPCGRGPWHVPDGQGHVSGGGDGGSGGGSHGITWVALTDHRRRHFRVHSRCVGLCRRCHCCHHLRHRYHLNSAVSGAACVAVVAAFAVRGLVATLVASMAAHGCSGGG